VRRLIATLAARCAPVLVVERDFPWLETFFFGSSVDFRRTVYERDTPVAFLFWVAGAIFVFFVKSLIPYVNIIFFVLHGTFYHKRSSISKDE